MATWTPNYQPKWEADQYPFDVQRYGVQGMELFDDALVEAQDDLGFTLRDAVGYVLMLWPEMVARLRMRPQPIGGARP